MKVKPHRCTARGRKVPDRPGAPTDEKLADGQHADHFVLCPEELAKGFVEPVRRAYQHVGIRPAFPTRELTAEEQEHYAGQGYVQFEEYPPEKAPATGRFWTEKMLTSGCGTVTTMPQAIAETYARDPGYYGSTFCCGCRAYFPVGEHGEFVWDDGRGQRVGTRRQKAT